MTEPIWMQVLDVVFIVVFVLEMCSKIIDIGFVMHKRSYLRDGWNVLDFIVVMISLLSFVFVNIRVLRALRTFRALRPLRLIRRNEGIQLIMTVLNDYYYCCDNYMLGRFSAKILT